MWLLPYNKTTLQTNLSKDEVRKRLQGLRQRDVRPYVYFMQPLKFIKFVGVIRKDSFYLQRRSGMYIFNESPPQITSIIIINGAIHEKDEGIVLEIKSHFNPLVFFIFCIPLLLFPILFLLPSIIKWLLFDKPFKVDLIFFPFLLAGLLLVYLILIIQYKFAYFSSSKFLKKLLEAKKI